MPYMETDKAFMEAVQSQLAAERGAAKLSLAESAKRAGMGRTTLHYIETGQRDPSVAQVMALCEVYGLPLSKFFARAEERSGK